MTNLEGLRAAVRRTSLAAQDAAYAAQASELTISTAPPSQGGPPTPTSTTDLKIADSEVGTTGATPATTRDEETAAPDEEAAPPAESGQRADASTPTGGVVVPKPPSGSTEAPSAPGTVAPSPTDVDARLRELSEELATLITERSRDAERSQAAADAAQAALAEELRSKNSTYLKKVGRRTFGWSLVAFLLALALGLFLRSDASRVTAITWDDAMARLMTGRSPLVVAAIAAIVLWLVLLAFSQLKAESGGLIRMLIGADGRLSTSYFQVWVWTLVLVWTFVFFVLMTFVGRGFADLAGTDGDFGINSDYLLLLGGPFAALVVARQVDQSKILSGDLQKTTASTTEVSDLFSSDSGRADLVDTQYLMFNVVALLVFFGSLWNDQSQLPDIPDAIMLLTSGAALGYIARKAVQRNPPAITSIIPLSGDSAPTTNRAVIIQGSNFIPSGAGTEESIRSVRVKFDAFSVRPSPEDPKEPEGGRKPTDPPTLRRDGITADSIRVVVPDLSADGKTERMVQVSVVTAPGVETAVFPVRITSPILRVRLEPVTVADGIATITLTLLDPTLGKSPVRIVVGTIPFDTFWIDDKASVRVNRASADNAALSVVSAGATFSAQLALPPA